MTSGTLPAGISIPDERLRCTDTPTPSGGRDLGPRLQYTYHVRPGPESERRRVRPAYRDEYEVPPLVYPLSYQKFVLLFFFLFYFSFSFPRTGTKSRLKVWLAEWHNEMGLGSRKTSLGVNLWVLTFTGRQVSNPTSTLPTALHTTQEYPEERRKRHRRPSTETNGRHDPYSSFTGVRPTLRPPDRQGKVSVLRPWPHRCQYNLHMNSLFWFDIEPKERLMVY